MDETSAISESLAGESNPNSASLEDRFGKRTLSSLAFPIFEFGSSCSRNMLNLAERLGMIRLVRKSSDDGSAELRSNSTLGGDGFFLPRKNDFPDSGIDADSDSTSLAFLLVLNRFILSRIFRTGLMKQKAVFDCIVDQRPSQRYPWNL